MLRKSLVLLSGNAATSLLNLIRNLAVARLLSLHDYGIAATFALAMAVVEMASALGLQQLIIQHRQGDDPAYQAALQGFQLVRGALAALAMLLLARPIALFLGVPEVTWAYRLLAITPLLNALVHFDVYRLNREMRFGPMVVSSLVPAAASLLAVFPLAWAFADWRALLWAILLQVVLTVLISHLVARRRWQLDLDRAVMAEGLRFGWPILLNAVLLFLMFQGERLIVGHVRGMAELAVYSMGVTLTLTPALVLDMSVRNFFLPQLSRIERGGAEEARFVRVARAALEVGLGGGAALVLAVVLLGGPLVHLLLGAKYAALIPLLGSLAVVYALRLMRSGTSVVFLSQGRTLAPVIPNLPHVLALPVAWLLLAKGGSLSQLIWLIALAELAGLALALVLARRVAALDAALPAVASAVVFVAAALAAAAVEAAGQRVGTIWAVDAAILLAFLGLLSQLAEVKGALLGRRQRR